MFRFKSFLSSICISLLFVGVCWSSAFSATLSVEDGHLLGATGVSIDGKFYDVTFSEATFEEIYGEATDYIWIGDWGATYAENRNFAVAASQALLDEVLVGDFNVDPELTAGITNDERGGILTLFQYSPTQGETGYWYVAYALNWSSESGSTDFVNTMAISQEYLNDHEDRFTIAIWTSSSDVSSVPVPTTILLLGSGLIGLTGFGRKKFNKA